ncbi:MAG: RidA family protein [Phycisphaerales bacterium]|mgnify:CR=1 FL=1|nr:RidA family protein [Phycisphaerales bacterium]
MNPQQRLAEMGLSLPPAPPPVASYVPYLQIGEMVYISGQLPMREGTLAFTGKVGGDLSLEQGAECARAAVLNALAQVAAAVGGLEHIRRIVRLGVFVNSAPGFTDQAKVANGASDLLAAVFGEAGKHVRAAVGVNELPLNAPVEVEMIAQVAS